MLLEILPNSTTIVVVWFHFGKKNYLTLLPPFLYSSMSRSSFFKVKLRGNSESKRGKRRPVSTTAVEVYHNVHHNQTTTQDHLKRSMSRDSIGR